MSLYRHDQRQRTGILLVNLGTPDEPTPAAVRRYLRQFLSDPRVVDANRVLWWFILNAIILRIRPGRVATAYQSIWTEDGSPLLHHNRELTEKLEASMEDCVVRLAMTYGNPSIPDVLAEMMHGGVRRLVVLPLYPQYSGSTTGAVFDAVAAALRSQPYVPELRFVDHYTDHPAYIEALADSVRRFWAANGKPDRLVFSFHGIPERYHRNGDPYPCHCRKTVRLAAEALALSEDEYEVAFQSRFGREPWLQPYLDQRMKQMPGEGLRRVHVICPGFAADCLETIEEVNMENRELFLESGGEHFSYIPALNADSVHVDAIERILRDAMGPLDHPSEDEELERIELQTRKAKELGAAA